MEGDRRILVASQISKRFGSTQALVDAHIEVDEAEMRALAGANGSGKSTFVKILSGYHEPEEGARLTIGGVDVSLPMHPSDFTKYGVACVHQDLGLIRGLSVAENLVTYEIASTRHFVHPRGLERTARKFLDLVEASLPLRAPVESVSRSARALIALARALGTLESFTKRHCRPGILVLDEITAFLPRHEVHALHNAIRRVRELGHAVVFVSHDLDEVLDTADSVTVLRNGRVVLTARASEVTHELLVRSIVGRAELEGAGEARDGAEDVEAADGTTVRVEGLSGAGVRDVSFSVDRGEILGLTGLIGSGFEEIPYLMFGAQVSSSGRMWIDGDAAVSLPGLTPEAAMALGLGLVPGDRAGQGLFGDLEIAENVGSLFLESLRRLRYLLSWRKMRRLGRSAIHDYRIVTTGERAFPRELSGGNQQKLLLARWLLRGERLLLLHEPVQGVDVAARAAIVELLRERASRGTPIVCASSDYQLLMELCDRAIVFRKGAIHSVLTVDPEAGRLSKERLAELSISDTDGAEGA